MQQEYKYEIMCKYHNNPWEHCDYAHDRQELNYLLNNYRMAYGNKFQFKTKRL